MILTLALSVAAGLLAFQAVYADSVAPAQIVQAGAAVEVTMALHNETTVDHTFALTVGNLPNDVSATFTQDGPVVEQAVVPAGATSLVTLRMQTTPQTPVGAVTVDFTAMRDDGSVLNMPLLLVVEKSFALQIVNQTLNVSAFSGQDFVFDVTAINSGAGTITNGGLRLDAPAKWLVRTDPATVASVLPGDQMAFHVTVSVPPSQVSVNQTLHVIATSDQAESLPGLLSVRVQNSPAYLYYAAGVIVLAAIGLLLYFRVNGRR